MPRPKYWTQRRDLKKVQANGTPKTGMYITSDVPGAPDPVDSKPKKKSPKPGTQEFLNKENDYDRNTYTPDMFPVKKRPTQSKA